MAFLFLALLCCLFTPSDSEVAEAILPFLYEEFGNPSSSHFYGKKAKLAVENARREVALLIGCKADEVVFTSGGTESNNWAIRCGAQANSRMKGKHLVTSSIEHPAVSEVINHLCQNEGFCKTVVPVDLEGRVDAEAVVKVATADLETSLVSIMHANNEVGSLQPIAEIAASLRGKGILVHTDASQSVGKIPINWRTLGVDLLTIAGHKLYGPKGVGALIIRRGVILPKFMLGAGHESGRRAGTENVALIVGLGKACEVARKGLDRNMRRSRAMRDRLLEKLEDALPGLRCRGDDIELSRIDFRVNGPADPEKQLPNTLSVSFKGVDGVKLMAAISPFVACSSGSACHAGHVAVSPVLAAMGVPAEYAQCTLRLSMGRETTRTDVDTAAEVIMSHIKSLFPSGVTCT
ncbi:hypothetical protein CBR_g8345 [Chara braunii]|uniref:cysteine desulfurase n=1 Tax=Chara braunii TaxID=69332 RepID=A0A388KLW8_CHABU|nr:hypothetical protein CBR_g8345 [Chara braunii]|eukprot:GBG71046.1 hypothetical protein CBR_g8345 [Chara braunii]